MKLNYVRKFLRLQYQCPDTRMISMRLTFVSAVILVPPPPPTSFPGSWNAGAGRSSTWKTAGLPWENVPHHAALLVARTVRSPHLRRTLVQLGPQLDCAQGRTAHHSIETPSSFFPVLAFFTAFFFSPFPVLAHTLFWRSTALNGCFGFIHNGEYYYIFLNIF